MGIAFDFGGGSDGWRDPLVPTKTRERIYGRQRPHSTFCGYSSGLGIVESIRGSGEEDKGETQGHPFRSMRKTMNGSGASVSSSTEWQCRVYCVGKPELPSQSSTNEGMSSPKGPGEPERVMIE